MDSQTELINLLSEMIRIDSRNSLPLNSTAPREATEQAMADCVTRKLQEFGFDSVSSQNRRDDKCPGTKIPLSRIPLPGI